MTLKLSLCILLSFVISIVANAQKLPEVQQTSLRAPSNVKVDGSSSEWGKKFQALNHATDIYYTMANDDENIYLIIKTQHGIDKIINNGISFTINHTLIKKDTASITITYPILQLADRNSISSLVFSRFGAVSRDVGPNDDNSNAGLNSSFTKKSKYIKVTGIKSISDENVSIYNSQGIKVASKFNEPLVYVYELAIPLKLLSLPNNGADGFSYHVKLNGDISLNKAGPTKVIFPNLSAPPPPDPATIMSTDFWGVYTLAKKP